MKTPNERTIAAIRIPLNAGTFARLLKAIADAVPGCVACPTEPGDDFIMIESAPPLPPRAPLPALSP